MSHYTSRTSVFPKTTSSPTGSSLRVIPSSQSSSYKPPVTSNSTFDTSSSTSTRFYPSHGSYRYLQDSTSSGYREHDQKYHSQHGSSDRQRDYPYQGDFTRSSGTKHGASSDHYNVSYPDAMNEMVKLAKDVRERCDVYGSIRLTDKECRICSSFATEAEEIKSSLDSKLRALMKYEQVLYDYQLKIATSESLVSSQKKELERTVNELKRQLSDEEAVTHTLLIGDKQTKQTDASRKQTSDKEVQVKFEDNAMKELSAKLNAKEKEIARLREEASDMTNQLSQIMHDKISLNETSVENVNVAARPSLVAEAYTSLMNNEWLDASLVFGEMEDYRHFEFLACIMKSAWMESQKLHADFKHRVWNVIVNPGQPSGASQHTRNASASVVADKMPAELQSALLNVLKQRSDKFDPDLLYKSTIEQVQRKFSKVKRYLSPDVEKYVKKCCMLGWKMAIQQPCMELAEDRLGKPLDPSREELFIDSKSRGVVALCVKPALMHRQKCLVKAVVILK